MVATTEIRRVINADMFKGFKLKRNQHLHPQDRFDLAEFAIADIVLALIGFGIVSESAVEMVDRATRYADSPNQVSCAIRNGLRPSLFKKISKT